jgi:hypothetical protein
MILMYVEVWRCVAACVYGCEIIAARWLRAKATSKRNQEELFTVVLAIVNRAEI